MRYRFLYLFALLLAACNQPATTQPPIATPAALLDSAAARSYRQQLQLLADADQEDRQRLFRVFRQYGFLSPQSDSASHWLRRQDSLHLRQFQQLEQRHGWPRAAQVGSASIGNAYLLLQHAPDSVHTRYLPRIEEAHLQGELTGPDYATYVDRYLLHRGRKQRYGTQYRRRVVANGRTEDYLDSIEDFAHVEHRRRALGLDSLRPTLVLGTLVLKAE